MDDNRQTMPPADAELQQTLDAMSQKSRKLLIGALISMGLCVALGIWAAITQNNGEEVPGYFLPLLLPPFVATAVFIILSSRSKKKLKEYVSAFVTRGLLEEVFEVEEYDGAGRISEDLINAAALIGGWNQSSGSDYVKGRYKGFGIVMSDIKLEQVTTRTDSDGDSHESRTTIFKGPWIVLEHNRELASALRLREKLSSPGKSDLETENAAFNQQFQILTQDGHTAFLILTPHFMEFLTSADEKARGRTLLCLVGNKICIALNNNRDSFEASGKDLKDLGALRENQRAEIRYLTDILDEIMKNDYLFGDKRPGERASTGEAWNAADPQTPAAGGAPVRRKANLLQIFHPIGLTLFAAYLLSAVYTLIRLPYGIILSTDIWSPDALSVPTPVYLLVLTVFVLGFMIPILKRHAPRTGLLTSIAGTGLLMLFHYLFVAANIAG